MEYYVHQHQDDAVIAKLKGNAPLMNSDVKALEKILWSDIGTQQEYEDTYGNKPLGEFVREIQFADFVALADKSEYGELITSLKTVKFAIFANFYNK